MRAGASSELKALAWKNVTLAVPTTVCGVKVPTSRPKSDPSAEPRRLCVWKPWKRHAGCSDTVLRGETSKKMTQARIIDYESMTSPFVGIGTELALTTKFFTGNLGRWQTSLELARRLADYLTQD